MAQSRRLLFISKVRQHPCLWDMESEFYRNYDMKENTWQAIVNELDWKEVPNVQTAKQEWKKLRDTHRDSLKRVRTNTSFKWKYADSMEFLVRFMRSRKTKRPLRTPETSPTHNSILPISPTAYLDTSDVESTSANNTDFPMENIKCELLDEETDGNGSLEYKIENIKESSCIGCKHGEPSRHPLDTFYQYLSDATKQFPPWLQNSVKKKMFAVLTEAEDSLENGTSEQ